MGPALVLPMLYATATSVAVAVADSVFNNRPMGPVGICYHDTPGSRQFYRACESSSSSSTSNTRAQDNAMLLQKIESDKRQAKEREDRSRENERLGKIRAEEQLRVAREIEAKNRVEQAQKQFMDGIVKTCNYLKESYVPQNFTKSPNISQQFNPQKTQSNNQNIRVKKSDEDIQKEIKKALNESDDKRHPILMSKKFENVLKEGAAEIICHLLDATSVPSSSSEELKDLATHLKKKLEQNKKNKKNKNN